MTSLSNQKYWILCKSIIPDYGKSDNAKAEMLRVLVDFRHGLKNGDTFADSDDRDLVETHICDDAPEMAKAFFREVEAFNVRAYNDAIQSVRYLFEYNSEAADEITRAITDRHRIDLDHLDDVIETLLSWVFADRFPRLVSEKDIWNAYLTCNDKEEEDVWQVEM